MMRAIGRAAEDAAADYLIRQGFVIIQRNFAIRGAEVDIIAKEGDCLVFVEVKCRNKAVFPMPRESVTPRKQQRICMGAAAWVQQQGMQEAPIRFDIVEVTPRGIVLLRAAFEYSA